MRHLPLLIIGALWAATAWSEAAATADAASTEAPSWSVERPNAVPIDIDVNEGTWLSLDVSPDGKRIAFDLLGDIYELPIAGGDARPVSQGMAWEMQPRYSPDGKTLVYISDRAGGDNIWLHDLASDERRQLTKEDFRLLNNAAFSPDGRFVVARKHFTTSRSLGTGELWLYHLAGGAGQQVLARQTKKHQKELGEPIFSPDGSAIYFSKDTTPGGNFQYAQDSNGQIFEILKLDLATGTVQPVVSGPGGAARPTPSPDGKTLAFVRRQRARTGLWLKDLATGAETPLVADLDQDAQEVWAVHGVYPNMAWTPDSASLIFWAGGKIRRVDVATRAVSDIPFRVRDQRKVVPVVRPQQRVFTREFETTMARGAVVSPDGRRAVFETLGRLYVKTLPAGEPRRLTSDRETRFEFDPAFSPDGRTVVFATWDDVALGSVRSVAARGGRSRALNTAPGHYAQPAYIEQDAVAVVNVGASALRDPRHSEAGLWLLRDGSMTRLTRSGWAPHRGTTPDGTTRVFFSERAGDRTLLKSVDLTGARARYHAAAPFATEFQLAPSGRYLAYRENYHIYALPMAGFAVETPDADTLLTLGRDKAGLPQQRVSLQGGNYPAWSGDTLTFSLGATLYWQPGATLDESKNKSDKKQEDKSSFSNPNLLSSSLSLTAKADRPQGSVLLTNATLITMDAEERVLENANLLVEGNRITALGSDISAPDGTPRIDLTGKTIVPGFIDAHAHGSQGRDGITPEQNYQNYATLALGVTTVHDPSNDALSFFAAQALQRTGQILAPRLFSTGNIVYGARSTSFAHVSKYAEALEHVQRLKAQGAGSIKNYNQPRRNQRQQVVEASQAENRLVVAEGGSLFHMDLALVADGNATIEHNLPQSTLYEDVVQFWSQTEVAYTPTLVVTYGGLTAETYWYQETDVWRHPILSRWVPPDVLQPRSVRRTKAPLEDYHHIRAAANAATLARAGVLVSIGAHGQREGLASHWEMWGFAQGGMTPMETLRTATSTPAKALGMSAEIGSLEVGKLADLVVLARNPLEDIFATDRIDRVMLNGRLYDAKTLQEQATGSFKPEPLYWQRER